ncbi:MAG: presqualene diphosphate synthase HpnD [Verrucomicrobia bacterium]|nr:presqualene diphosphate synthase HpnD [Verrucomicrobiota bacterium]
MQVSESITRKSASNLALAFILLPKERRAGMAVLYAFCREVDDIADDESLPIEERRRRLSLWRSDVRAACEGGVPDLPVVRELQPVIAHYGLTYSRFDELLRGVEMDLDIKRYATYAELDEYCYRVASVVGLLSIEIFGYENPGCHDYAVYLGKALQLTNILRDVRSDGERGRIYLPMCELQRFGVTPEDILECRYSARFYELAQSVAGRARGFYLQAGQALPAEDRRSMASAELMGSVYWRLLEKLEHHRFNVFDSASTRLSKTQKLFLIGRTWLRVWRGALTPNYGVS